MIRFVAPLAVILLAASHLPAQQMNGPDAPCANIAGTSDLVSCLWKAKASSEAEMKSQYNAISKLLEEAEVKQLVKSQELWVKYREANCAAERSLYGTGTAEPPAYLACVEAMTRQRTKELKVAYAVRLKN
jgi:uncharacterized protein YecT (DUF1311 family)